MKFVIQIIIIAALGWIAGQFLPWWSIAIAGFVGGFMLGGRNFRDFMAGLISAGGLWAVSCLLAATGTGSLLPDRMAQLISPSLDGTLLALIAGVIGGLLAGFGSMTGGQLRKTFRKK